MSKKLILITLLLALAYSNEIDLKLPELEKKNATKYCDYTSP